MKMLDFTAGTVTGLAAAAVGLMVAMQFGAATLGAPEATLLQVTAVSAAPGVTARPAVPPPDGKRLAEIEAKYRLAPPNIRQ